MIEHFACKQTEKVWKGLKSKKWSDDIANNALRKLIMLNAAGDINDLRIPPSNHLHKLKGNMKEYWAISVNKQWRIIFNWVDSKAHNVQIIDYH